MNILVWSSALICFAFLTHLIIWKIHLPKRQTKVLLQIFFGILFLALALFSLKAVRFPLLGQPAPTSFSECLHVALFFISLTLAYMITYSALEADSPTLVMVMNIAGAGSAGLKKESFDKLMTDDILVKPRIKDLLTDQMAVLNDGKYILTSKGVLFARIFITFRKILGAEKGG